MNMQTIARHISPAQEVFEDTHPPPAQEVVEENHPPPAREVVEDNHPPPAQEVVEDNHPPPAQEVVEDQGEADAVVGGSLSQASLFKGLEGFQEVPDKRVPTSKSGFTG